MLRSALFVLSLAMLTSGALAAQSAITIAHSVQPDPLHRIAKADKQVLVMRWDGISSVAR